MTPNPHTTTGSESLAATPFNPAEIVASRLHVVSVSAGRVVRFDSLRHPEYIEREAAEQAAAEAAHKARLAAAQIVHTETMPLPESLPVAAEMAPETEAARFKQEAYDKLAEAFRAA